MSGSSVLGAPCVILSDEAAALPYAHRRPASEHRTAARLRAHYELERSLADRLKRASAESRMLLYTEVYDLLFELIDDHPQLSRVSDPAERACQARAQARSLSSLLPVGGTFLEIGAGDCALSKAVAPRARTVRAVDASWKVVDIDTLPGNVTLVNTDGISIDVAENSVDLAYSSQLIEHLHPADVMTQLRNIWRALKPGGSYVCLTPHQFMGPSDISMYFDNEARGLHLHEYTHAELAQLYRAVGFSRVCNQVGAKGRYRVVPIEPVIAIERWISGMPFETRRRVARTAFHPALRIHHVVTK